MTQSIGSKRPDRLKVILINYITLSLAFIAKALSALKTDGKIEFNDTLDISSGYGRFILGNLDDKVDKTFRCAESKSCSTPRLPAECRVMSMTIIF
jgi:hypothetical protein